MPYKPKIYLCSLGCARNLVDSEIMLGNLTDAGFAVTPDASQADVIIVNTCSFVEAAIDESVDAILELAQYKKTGKCKRLIVTGCLPERFRKKIATTLPEVTVFLGTGAYDEILSAASGKTDPATCVLPKPAAHPLQRHDTQRVVSTSSFKYLKITEGCNRRCTYCIIPKLRGRLRSRTVEDVVCEAEQSIAAGFKELVIIGQDTYSYGSDLRPKATLGRLLARIAELSKDVWIRVLYGSPDTTDDELIQTVAAFENICSYFDIPVQHASPAVLKKMGRHYSKDDLVRIFEKIRVLIPDAVLRTTFLVGFPGETDSDFKQLLDFMQKVRFNHAGAFMYSDSEDLASHRLKNHVGEKAARRRYDRLMQIQRDISLDHNRQYVGKTYSVLIEKQMEGNLYAGRTWFQAPEVDGVTFVETASAEIGNLISVQITDAYDYDLKGKAV